MTVSSGSGVTMLPGGSGGAASGITIGTSVITGGTTGRPLYDNGGVVGEYTAIPASFGGTGVANDVANTLTWSGAFAATFTLTGATGVTFPTSGTLATTSQLATLPLSGANGGTGIANTGFTITLAGNVITTGAFNTTFIQQSTRSITLPGVDGTLAILGANTFSAAQLFTAGTVSAPGVAVGEAGTGLYQTATGKIGITVGGTLKLDYAQTNAAIWTSATEVRSANGVTVAAGAGIANASGGLYLQDGTANSVLLVNIGAGQEVVYLGKDIRFGWSSATLPGTSSGDTLLVRGGAAILQMGAATGSGAAVAQTFTVQGSSGASAVAALFTIAGSDQSGTGTTGGAVTLRAGNTSGASGTRNGGALTLAGGTGASVGGAIALQTAATTSLVTALGISAAGLITLPLISSDAGLTDSSVCQDTTTHGLYAGSGTLGICLGTSSARYKRDIGKMSGGLPDILALKPVSFHYRKGRGDSGARKQVGFLAEDVVETTPDIVGRDKEGRPNTVDMLALVPLLTKAIQEQQMQIDELRARMS